MIIMQMCTYAWVFLSVNFFVLTSLYYGVHMAWFTIKPCVMCQIEMLMHMCMYCHIVNQAHITQGCTPHRYQVMAYIQVLADTLYISDIIMLFQSVIS